MLPIFLPNNSEKQNRKLNYSFKCQFLLIIQMHLRIINIKMQYVKKYGINKKSKNKLNKPKFCNELGTKFKGMKKSVLVACIFKQ
jgi:hypothetical protein